MVIRRATGDDADALTDLAHRAKAHWGYPASWMREWDPQLTIIPGYLEAHDVWLAERDGAIVGMCALEDRGARWNLEHVWVEPAVHGARDRPRARDGGARRGAAPASRVVELLADPYASGFTSGSARGVPATCRRRCRARCNRTSPRDSEFDLDV